MTAEDKQRFVAYLVSEGYLDATSHTYKAFDEPRSRRSVRPRCRCCKSGFRSRMRSVPAIDGTAAAPMFQPVGGMDQFPKGFQHEDRRRQDHVQRRSAVGPPGRDSGVKVVYLDTKTGKKTEVSADFVVICMPLTVLANVDINLSPEMMEAVKATTYSNSAKMGLAMKRRFWEEDDKIFGGHLYSNLPIGEFSYPSNDYFTQKGVLLGLYINNAVGDLIDKPVKDRVEHVLMNASKVHPQIRDEFESAYAVWWKKVKYNQGGYASGSAQARRAQLSKLDNRVLIGSAVTTPYSQPDWQEGAVSAGWQALKTIHERAMQA